MVNLQSTRDVHSKGVSILCYSVSGGGKTHLIGTLPNPVIFSAESGLLTLVDKNIPYTQIKTYDELIDAYKWAKDSSEAAQFDSIAIDSISEIAEVILAHEKKKNADGRKAYGEMQDQMNGLIRSFRDLPKNVYMTAKLEKQQDEMGKILYYPSMPGNKTAQGLPYFFDAVVALHTHKDESGKIQRALMTTGDSQWIAKVRMPDAPAWHEPDLGKLIQKIKGIAS